MALLPDYEPGLLDPVVPLDGDTFCGSLSRMGDIGSPDYRYALIGPRDNPDPHLARKSDDKASPLKGATAELGVVA